MKGKRTLGGTLSWVVLLDREEMPLTNSQDKLLEELLGTETIVAGRFSLADPVLCCSVRLEGGGYTDITPMTKIKGGTFQVT